MKLPGPRHPIDIEPCAERVRVIVDGEPIADSVRALRMREAGYPPVIYVPRDDVRMSALTATAQTTHCPFKGDASYFVAADSGGARDAIAWSYEHPYPAMAAIRDHVAFYPDRVDAIRLGQ